jgi:hypothetical protein
MNWTSGGLYFELGAEAEVIMDVGCGTRRRHGERMRGIGRCMKLVEYG